MIWAAWMGPGSHRKVTSSWRRREILRGPLIGADIPDINAFSPKHIELIHCTGFLILLEIDRALRELQGVWQYFMKGPYGLVPRKVPK